jgi:hypothetical protein
MTYKIISEREQVTKFTLVEFDFDGVKVEVDISHFPDISDEAVKKGIENRAITEAEILNINP